MQKLPRFGEKIRTFDEVREKECMQMLVEFLKRSEKFREKNECDAVCESEVYRVRGNQSGLHTRYGLHVNDELYITPEEAFYLCTRKLIKFSPLLILSNTQVFIQKVLIFSYFKRKGFDICNNQHRIYETLNKHLGVPVKKKIIDTSNNDAIVKEPRDILDVNIKCAFIHHSAQFEKIEIKPWNPQIK